MAGRVKESCPGTPRCKETSLTASTNIKSEPWRKLVRPHIPEASVKGIHPRIQWSTRDSQEAVNKPAKVTKTKLGPNSRKGWIYFHRDS